MGQSESQPDDKTEKHANKHHPYPKSRIPKRYHKGENSLISKEWATIETPSEKAHGAFNVIFGNRYPKEQLEFLKGLCDNSGILNPDIYNDHKESFDLVFGIDISLVAMREVLKKWDLPKKIKKKYADKIAKIHQVLNNEISGGIPIEKHRLN